MHINEYLENLFNCIALNFDNENSVSLQYIIRQVEINVFKNALRQSRFVKTKTAKLLGYKRTNFLAKIESLNLEEFCEQNVKNKKTEKKEFVLQVIKTALTACKYNVSQTARYLGIKRETLENQIERNNLNGFIRKNKKLLQYGKLAE